MSSSKKARTNPRRVGIVGYGSLGQFLAGHVMDDPRFELAFVWNRSVDKMSGLKEDVILRDLHKFEERRADLIVEVAHPKITLEYGPRFLLAADYMVGSPTAFADAAIEAAMTKALAESPHSLYVPAGALWGANDIQKMASRGSLKGLTITMKKHPGSLKVEDALKSKVEDAKGLLPPNTVAVIYEGPVRDLCPLAPNNVNTMACAAMAASNLGFDGVRARLIADNTLVSHDIEIDVEGPEDDGMKFEVRTQRINPARPGAVTGNATYTSFWSSLIASNHRGPGMHFV